MRILLVTHYFPPEVGAPQARLSEMARYWANGGEQVTVLTGMPNHPTGVIPTHYRGRLRAEEHVDGYRVIRTWVYATPNEGIVKKTLGHLSFMASSVLLGWKKSGRPDVVIVSSPTFFSIFSAWLLAKLKGARFVLEIRDLWPAIFVELGVLTNRFVIKLLERIEIFFYRAADAVVVVSEGFRSHLIGRGIDSDKIITIRNGADLHRFDHSEGSAKDRALLGANADETLVLYLGAHGISHGLISVANAASILAGKPIHFAFVGEGAAKKELVDHVGRLELANVTMLPAVPSKKVPAFLAAADICLVPLRDVPLFSTFIPSKIFEYFAASRAVVGAVRGEPAEILREGGAKVVEPEDSAAIAAAIQELSNDPVRRKEMGREAHKYVSTNFNRRTLAETYRVLLARVVETHE